MISKESLANAAIIAVYIVLNVVLHLTNVNPTLTQYVDGGLGILLTGNVVVQGYRASKAQKQTDPGNEVQ